MFAKLPSEEFMHWEDSNPLAYQRRSWSAFLHQIFTRVQHSIKKITSRLMAKIQTSESSKSIEYSNSSLRRTSQMRLLQANIPSEMIQKKVAGFRTWRHRRLSNQNRMRFPCLTLCIARTRLKVVKCHSAFLVGIHNSIIALSTSIIELQNCLFGWFH